MAALNYTQYNGMFKTQVLLPVPVQVPSKFAQEGRWESLEPHGPYYSERFEKELRLAELRKQVEERRMHAFRMSQIKARLPSMPRKMRAREELEKRYKRYRRNVELEGLLEE